MVEQVTFQTLFQFLQTVGILVGVFYYISTIRTNQRNQEIAQKNQELTLKAQEHTLETRQTQIFMQIYQQLNSEETYKSWAELINLKISDYEDYLQKYDSSVNPTHYSKRAHIWYSYNTIGELLRQGIIESDLVHRLLLGPQVIVMWEKWVDIIRETRKRESIPDVWEGFEYLYDEMKRLRDSREYPEITFPKLN